MIICNLPIKKKYKSAALTKKLKETPKNPEVLSTEK